MKNENVIFKVCEILNFTYFFLKIQDKWGKIWYYFSEKVIATKENIKKYNLRVLYLQI